MNKWSCDVLSCLHREPFINQRTLAERCGISLGNVNKSVKCLTQEGYLDDDVRLTEKARLLFAEKKPRRAIILAAGFGMRMVPINTQTPKALLEVNGETLIERTIRQLHQADVREIYVVVGFMKEQLEYLIDEYNVTLIVNEAYAEKNNLHSLKAALPHLSNAYVIPCDVWCKENPFCENELYSWYMVSGQTDADSTVRVNRSQELVVSAEGQGGNAMVGISYLAEPEAGAVRARLEKLAADPRYDGAFWEEALYEKDRMLVQARVCAAGETVEINTYEQLRELDSSSNHLRSDAISTIARVLGVQEQDIGSIEVLKKGMTNRSFLFSAGGAKYIMRIPGEGTDQLINRRQEAAVYRAIAGKGLCDDVVYLNPDNGYKITRYIENIRCCDPEDLNDLRQCMDKLRAFHQLGLQVDHEFNIWENIEFYERLWNGQKSVFRDYGQTKANVLRLRAYIDAQPITRVLTHIDAVPDNFLFGTGADGQESLQLTDWEYAGLQDPHVDIAMFCIYSLYGKPEIDRLIDLYFEGACPAQVRTKIYCYVACCGLLWSNWCEYKRNLGVEFGEYSLRQYRYAKEFYRYALQAMEEEKA